MRHSLLWAGTLLLLVAGCFVYSQPAFAQLTLPAGADVDLYFPQIADGGDAIQRWQTTLFFVNPNDSSAQGTFYFFAQDGSPLTVQLGTVSGSIFNATVPPHGSVSFRTTGSANSIRSGWALAHFDKPIQGTAAYRVLVNEIPRQEVAVNAVLINPLTVNFANAFSGIAIANPWPSASISVTATILDSSGTPVATRQVLLGPLQQTARVLSEWFGVPTSFTGSVRVSTPTIQAPIVLVINADSQGVISSMPPGGVAGFVSELNAIWTVFNHLVSVLNSDPALAVGHPSIDVNLYLPNRYWPAYSSPDGIVHIAPGLVELVRSRDELAFAIAHELGHQWQLVHGRNFSAAATSELDADVFGLTATIVAGYDAYAAGGWMGKMMIVYDDPSLLGYLFENAIDVHTSFPNRLDNLWQTIQQACSSPSASVACQTYRNISHPLLPGLLGEANDQPAKMPEPGKVPR